ncbi:Laminin EGF domain [Popillia japonica]|uniref:Laminin EGF domain n=1 Tax=Popillia japonica TaxID=7064 RepID=A0AAW1LSU8_POPJA
MSIITQCDEHHFTCDDGSCIDIRRQCDGRPDCSFGEDEINCGKERCNSAEAFTCGDGQCIQLSSKCNRECDCSDCSDEKNCQIGPCNYHEIQCNNGECIDEIKKCNQQQDCADGSDELNCSACPSDQFQCNDGRCLDLSKKCDGLGDCKYSEDERNCVRCKEDEISCADGQCISSSKKCDGTDDCADGSDEDDCDDVGCKEGEFSCLDGQCINSTKKCDGKDDCADGLDEDECDDGEHLEPCGEYQFQCKAGFCIMDYKRCNGIKDCPSGNDEDNCPLSTTPAVDQCNFRCPAGNCGQRCDTYIDCPDGSDEDGCTCDIDQFTCSNGHCIDEHLRCDGKVDCLDDGSDEEHCVYNCPKDHFKCDNVCMIDKRRCDGYVDCKDGADERNCSLPHICPDNEFSCGDGQCIQTRLTCDGFPDCENNADERNCDCSLPGKFDCGGGHCIPEPLKCNNITDCPDGRDESKELCKIVCSASQHACDNRCIAQQNICDGIAHCQDGSDERDCACRPDQFSCLTEGCIPIHLHCDGNHDCSDGSDEQNCLPPSTASPPEPIYCQYGYELCRSGDQCYPRDRQCNNVADCRDGSDEWHCQHRPTTPPYPQHLNLKTYPNAQDIKESREVVFQCRDEGPLRAAVKWSRANNLPLPPGSRDNLGRLEIPNIQLQHSGTYICSARSFPPHTPGAQVSVELSVQQLIIPTSPPREACKLDEATCSNGDCIPKQLVCNGKFDCSDGSDETRCSPHGCEPNEFRCANKRCVLKTWVCDSDDDCGDGSDEVDCGTSRPGSQCSNKQFRCHSGNQCIPKSFHCDSENDCVDRSDEIGCSPVTIVKPPPPMMHLQASTIFEVTCTAVGVPTPEIVWRLNWGHIPEKCKTTSINGTGVLTCPDIQVQDSGAYSCEAINIRGSVFAVPDVILVVTDHRPGICPSGSFNEEAKFETECIPCFCFGIVTTCKSADLYTYHLQPPFDAHKVIGVNVRPNGQVDVGDTSSSTVNRTIPTPSRFGVQVYRQRTDTGSSYVPYFEMPENYNSNQLKSYGGYLKYNIQYRGYGAPLSFAPDVIVSGNGYTLLHYGEPIQPDRTQDVTVRFFEGQWFRMNERGEKIPASRGEIMMVLESVSNILIKLQYTHGEIDTKLDSVEMDSAASRNTGLGQATFVEDCSCPLGYSGYSCESCAPGYVRQQLGPWLGKCYKDDKCPYGTYGDPSRGIKCELCPCPHSSAPNQFTQSCHLGPRGQPICDCPTGYRGETCNECDTGYTGNPLQPGDYCKPVVDTCDTRGSLSQERDAYGQCHCKQLTTGRNCDQCQANTFYLSSDNLFGCIDCFCMGVTQSCRSSDYHRNTISAIFASSKHDFKIVTGDDFEHPTDQGITLDPTNREIVFNSFTSQPSQVKYWALPNRFLGDKITSYGGNLQYTVRYTPTPGGSSSRNTAADVELISKNNIKLSYYHNPHRDYPSSIDPNTPQTITVPLLERYWQRDDGLNADRAHLLMALADVRAILIKATYTTNSQEVALSSVSLDIAEGRNTGNPKRAFEVEHCECPPGYTGLSCQDCAPGYKRSDAGLYLGACSKCDCNGYSDECDIDTGVCINCDGHRTGPYCEHCQQGYKLNIHNQCERIGVTDCLCDPRGSVSNNCDNGYCQCKTNVIGQTCNRCRPGTFGLNANLTEGCQSCFCSGVSTDCSEGNMYIEQIPSEILEENHNFSLTDQFFRNQITTGFEIRSRINEIGYVFRPSQSERLFWSLPRKFTGQHITSYGGKLEFKQRYTQRPNAQYLLDQDIIISGNGMTIYWSNEKRQQPGIANKISVVLSPASNWQRLDSRQGPRPASREDIMRSVVLSPASNWQRLDSRQGPRPASREDIMRVLANIDSILIRAQLSSDTASSFISDITLDTALQQRYGQHRTVNVEVCRCPPAYTGTSCESCAPGYYSDITESPLESCARCPCNNRETSCELLNGYMKCNCQPGFTGHDCSIDVSSPTEGPPVEPTPYPPTIVVTIREPALQIVDVGSTVEFQCEAKTTTSNAVKIYWTRDGGSLPDRATEYEGLLVITDVRISDSGRYICEASDGISIVSQHITLTVGGNPPEPPRATIYPQSIDIHEGEQFEIQCEVTGNPLPNIQWEREGNVPFNPRQSTANGHLRISYAVASDAGRYICRATNLRGTDTAYIDVNVRYVPTQVIEPRITPEYFSGDSGSTFSLTCETNEDYTSIRWEKLNGYLPPHHVSVNGVLTLRDARPEDSGVYMCIVTIASGQSGNKTASVSIYDPYPDASGVPTVRVTPKNQTVGQGSTVEIYCDVTGTPPPTVKWTRVREDFGPTTQQIGNVLRISPVNIEDRGIYICVASNSHGIADNSSMLLVERRERPEIDIYPAQPQTINAGGDVQIVCRITAGIPEPYITWSREDGRPIGHHIHQGSDLLTISNIKIEDEGIYTCSASNELGKAVASTTINVIVPPRIVLSHSTPLLIQQGHDVILECRAEGHPTPTVQWHRQLASGQPDILSIARSAVSFAKLEIASVQTSDEGLYTCRASNEAGSHEEYLQLQVDAYPTRGDITGEDAGSDVDYPPSKPDVRDNERPPNVLYETMLAPAGTRAELRCRVDRYDARNPIQMKWIRQDNQSLPYTAQTSGSTLYIDNVQPSDAGDYICLGLDSYDQTKFTVTVRLQVVALPRISLVPRRQVVRPSENAYIQCRVTGDQPIDIQWHAVGRDMPPSVYVRDGYLEFRGIQVSDAGMYRCTAINPAGKADSVAEVLVDEKSLTPTISAEKRLQIALPGSSVTLHCVVAQPSSRDQVHWYREHYPLPSSAYIQGEFLTISDLQQQDGGRYYCEVPVNGGGVVNDYIDVEIQTDHRSIPPPSQPSHPVAPELTISPSSYDVKYGDFLDLHCRSNEPGVILTWSKLNGRFADNIQSVGGVLRFVSITTENNGVYRCETRGASGYYYKDYTVEIIDTVQEPTAPPLNIQLAPQGESIFMECKTDLEEPVSYQWSKQGGELPHDVNAYSKLLRINDLTSHDAGTYVCSASNGRQDVTTPTVLVVTKIVPYFAQAPNSYLALPTIPDHYARLNFEISFKPESDYGLILYNGNNKRKDFISLAISGGYIEFKFNLGHDTTTLVSHEPVQKGKWHTVKVRRDRKTGIMYVDGKGPVTETGKGKYSGLTLIEPLYLGGVPNYHNIPADIDIKSGFVGCISQLKVGHNYYDLLREASAKTGVTICETCQENPCQNQGVCQESLSKEGYTCICTEGFSGPTCNKVVSESCTPYTCGVGRCIDNEYSYECHCPLGRAGSHCEREVSIYEPAFTKNAYVAYPALKLPRRLKINLKIKPKDLTDAILMYSAQDSEGHGNFISLAIKDEHVEFRYDVGNGPVIIRSDNRVKVGEDVIISAMKSLTEVRLMVTGGNMVVEKPLGGPLPLSLHTPLFLGGINKAEISVNPGVGVSSGFNGCIGEFNIVGVDLKIIESAIGSANVLDCSSLNSDNNDLSNDINSGRTQNSHDGRTGCSSNPCCWTMPPTDYKCSCVNGYSGRDCEIAPNQCDQLRPCENTPS